LFLTLPRSTLWFLSPLSVLHVLFVSINSVQSIKQLVHAALSYGRKGENLPGAANAHHAREILWGTVSKVFFPTLW
jgi:hypothetical protein